MRRRGRLSLVSPNRRSPAPTATGKTVRRSSSTRSCSISVRTSGRLPYTTISPCICCLSFETSLTTSPARTVAFVHLGSWSVRPGALRLGQFELRPRLPVLAHELNKPAAVPEPAFAARVLDDAVERDILADHDLSHLDSPRIRARPGPGPPLTGQMPSPALIGRRNAAHSAGPAAALPFSEPNAPGGRGKVRMRGDGDGNGGAD